MESLNSHYANLVFCAFSLQCFFIKCLSQRIRHLRWAAKKKTLSVQPKKRPGDKSPIEGTPPKTARGAALPSLAAPLQSLDDGDYDNQLMELNKEWRKGPTTRNIQHVKLLLREIFQKNQEWIRGLPDSKIALILSKITCYESGEMVNGYSRLHVKSP